MGRTFAIRYEAAKSLVLYTSSDGSSSTADTVLAVDVPEGWTLVEVTKSGTSVSWTLNGSPVSSSGGAVATLYASDTGPLIGAAWSSESQITREIILGIK